MQLYSKTCVCLTVNTRIHTHTLLKITHQAYIMKNTDNNLQIKKTPADKWTLEILKFTLRQHIRVRWFTVSGGACVGVCMINEKKRSERRQHCALAVVRLSQKFSPRRRPLPGDAGRPNFNQLKMVITFIYRPSLVKIDACNFELSW